MSDMAILVSAAALIAPAMLWMLLPENRRRRQQREAERAIDRLERRAHVHEWGQWSEPDERRVYASGVTAGETKDRLPIRRDHYQQRVCLTCGIGEEHVF